MYVCYCDKFGLTPLKRAERLQVCDLSRDDERYGRLLQDDVIKPNIETLFDSFYSQLLEDREARKIVGQGFDLENLKNTQKSYLLSLGLGFDQIPYFESRLRIGHVHLRAGLRLSLYQCAYRILQTLLIEHIPPAHPCARELVTFILKITTFDMSLAIQAYECELSEQEHFANRKGGGDVREDNAIDSLTGVLNRQRFIEILNKRLENARGEIPVTLLMIDLDRFREVNYTHGNVIGDEILQRVAERIRSSIRTVNSIGRFGGEEFAVVLHNIDLDEGANVAERVRQKLETRPIKIDQVEVTITVSVGVASVEGETSSVDSLISRAADALALAKQVGGNRVELVRNRRHQSPII